MLPIDCRSLTGTFFAADAYAGLRLTPRRAKTWFQKRQNSSNAIEIPQCRRNPLKDFTPIDGDDELICDGPSSLPARLAGFLRETADGLICSYPIKFGRRC